VRDADNGAPDRMLRSVLSALLGIVVMGLGILVGLVSILLKNEVKTDAIFGVILAYLLTLFGISFSLSRQATKLIDHKVKGWSAGNPGFEQLPRQRTTAQLEEFREPAMSVTDHTTRTLDKVPIRDT
jgi:hypothetical protein